MKTVLDPETAGGERFRHFAAGQNPSVQMMLPMAESSACYSKALDTCGGNGGLSAGCGKDSVQ
jgi:hypothetical protein